MSDVDEVIQPALRRKLELMRWSIGDLARAMGVSHSLMRDWVIEKKSAPESMVDWLTRAAEWHEQHPPPRVSVYRGRPPKVVQDDRDRL